jgi:hypothetical protein
MENDQEKGSVKRRDVLKVIGAAPAAALVSVKPSMGQAHMHAAAAAPAAAAGAYQPKVLDPHQWQTVAVLSDLIIPADARSGSATQAGVPEFIDDWLDFRETMRRRRSAHMDNEDGELKAQILGGLTWLDMETNRQFGHDFIDCTLQQQKQMLDRIAYPKKAAPADANGVAFFNDFRDLVVSGFFSSKIGIADLGYMGNTVVAEWNGCPPNVLARLGFKPDGTPA